MTTILTYPQARVLSCLSRTGKVPCKANAPILRRLARKGFINLLPMIIEQNGKKVFQPLDCVWELTAAGAEALDQYEIAEACRELSDRCNRLLS
jgi:hypothetical protein